MVPTFFMKPIKVTLKDQNCPFIVIMVVHLQLLKANLMDTDQWWLLWHIIAKLFIYGITQITTIGKLVSSIY